LPNGGSVRLLVLGVLAERPMHGYELRKLAEESRLEAWSGILPGSIYHALKQLEKERLVRLAKTEQTGRRRREVYQITRAGRAAIAALIREAWQDPIRSLPTGLYGALAFRRLADPAAERLAIERQIADLTAEIEAWERARPLKGPLSADQSALFDNGLDHLRADLALLRRLGARGKRVRVRVRV
jgi:DNA-binding PadR family transcriptional regulator